MRGKVVTPEGLGALLEALSSAGFELIGPTIHNGSIVLDHIESIADLPVGWTELQEKGRYRLAPRPDGAFFGYTVGPAGAKRWLFPPRQTLLTIEHRETGLRFRPEPVDDRRLAFIGLRGCDLAAVAIHDRVFASDPFADPNYVARRDRSFTIGVNCATAAATCFCTSMDTGPRCTEGCDLILTEVITDDRHDFVLEVETEDGASILDTVPGRAIEEADRSAIEAVVAATERAIQRTLDREGTRMLLADNPEHRIWSEIAERCLSCTNCTLVCPTCFCSTMEDQTDLGDIATRERRWDSCFDIDFTGLHGHPVRGSTRSRYRQWMTHKLSSWYDQFGVSGCVGCGRCITWCPAGIDITEEASRFSTTIGVDQ